MRPDASEEQLDVALGRVLVDLHARVGADAQHGAVGEEAHARPTLLGDQDVVELKRHGRRERLRLAEAEDGDLSGRRLEGGNRLGRGRARDQTEHPNDSERQAHRA